MELTQEEINEIVKAAEKAYKAELERRVIEAIFKKCEDRLNFSVGSAMEQLEPAIKKLFPM